MTTGGKKRQHVIPWGPQAPSRKAPSHTRSVLCSTHASDSSQRSFLSFAAVQMLITFIRLTEYQKLVSTPGSSSAFWIPLKILFHTSPACGVHFKPCIEHSGKKGKFSEDYHTLYGHSTKSSLCVCVYLHVCSTAKENTQRAGHGIYSHC